MKDFMLIFRGEKEAEEAFSRQSPAEMQKEMEKWTKWMGSLSEKGKLVGGQPLLPTGKVLRANGGKLTDGPYTEGKDIVGGYMLIKANDLSEATQLSRDCPHLDGKSATVEVREIMLMPS